MIDVICIRSCQNLIEIGKIYKVEQKPGGYILTINGILYGAHESLFIELPHNELNTVDELDV